MKTMEEGATEGWIGKYQGEMAELTWKWLQMLTCRLKEHSKRAISIRMIQVVGMGPLNSCFSDYPQQSIIPGTGAGIEGFDTHSAVLKGPSNLSNSQNTPCLSFALSSSIMRQK